MATIRSPITASCEVFGDGKFDWRAVVRCRKCHTIGPDIDGDMAPGELRGVLAKFVSEHEQCFPQPTEGDSDE